MRSRFMPTNKGERRWAGAWSAGTRPGLLLLLKKATTGGRDGREIQTGSDRPRIRRLPYYARSVSRRRLTRGHGDKRTTVPDLPPLQGDHLRVGSCGEACFRSAASSSGSLTAGCSNRDRLKASTRNI